MKLLILVVVALVALIAMVAGIGYSLPVKQRASRKAVYAVAHGERHGATHYGR